MIRCQNALMHLTWHAEGQSFAASPLEVRDYLLETMGMGYVMHGTSGAHFLQSGEMDNSNNNYLWVMRTALGIEKFTVESKDAEDTSLDSGSEYVTMMSHYPWALQPFNLEEGHALQCLTALKRLHYIVVSTMAYAVLSSPDGEVSADSAFFMVLSSLVTAVEYLERGDVVSADASVEEIFKACYSDDSRMHGEHPLYAGEPLTPLQPSLQLHALLTEIDGCAAGLLVLILPLLGFNRTQDSWASRLPACRAAERLLASACALFESPSNVHRGDLGWGHCMG